MHGADIGVMVLLALGFWRGRTHGIGNEAYRLVRMALPIAGGCGIYTLVSTLVGAVPGFSSESAGLIGFVGGIGVTFFLVRKLLATLKRVLEARFGDARNMAAGLLGVVRSGVLALAMITGIELSAVDGLTESSWSGKAMSALFDAPDASADSD